jgi:hypothetical protein
MDLLHFLLSILIGLFPKILLFSPARHHPGSASDRRSRTRFSAGYSTKEYIIGHRRIGWYCVTVEVIPDDWLPCRVIDISTWKHNETNNSKPIAINSNRDASKNSTSKTPPTNPMQT